jgi:hypothetical protein
MALIAWIGIGVAASILTGSWIWIGAFIAVGIAVGATA